MGESRLSDAECLAVLLRCGRAGEGAEAMARRILSHFGGVVPLASAEVREVSGLPGVGIVRAAAIAAAFGLARRLAESRCPPGTTIRSGRDVARVVLETARTSRREAFFLLLLDARHRVQGLRVISIGGLDSAPVHPREVFGPAVRAGAAAIVVAHNHPSGDASPSVEDRRVTERLTEVGEVVGIRLLDHVVVGADRLYSFADQAYAPIP